MDEVTSCSISGFDFSLFSHCKWEHNNWCMGHRLSGSNNEKPV